MTTNDTATATRHTQPDTCHDNRSTAPAAIEILIGLRDNNLPSWVLRTLTRAQARMERQGMETETAFLLAKAVVGRTILDSLSHTLNNDELGELADVLKRWAEHESSEPIVSAV